MLKDSKSRSKNYVHEHHGRYVETDPTGRYGRVRITLYDVWFNGSVFECVEMGHVSVLGCLLKCLLVLMISCLKQFK